MAKKYLDTTGLTRLWSIISSAISSKQNRILYGSTEPTGGKDGDVYMMPATVDNYDKIGDLSTLITDDQTTIVGAMNEIYDRMYPVGSVYCSSTNTDPATIFGGTWTLIDKDFTPGGGNATLTLGKSSSATLAYYKSGKNIYCRLTFVNNAQLNDTSATVATINLASMGVSDLTYTKYPVGQTDGGAAILMMGVNASSGVIAVNDVIDKGGSNVVSAGATCYVEWSNTIGVGNMLDSACNKFYFKRTA